MDETKQMIDARIRILEEGLKTMTPGSEGYESVTSAIAELLKIRAQLDKDELSAVTTAEEGKKDRWVKIGTTAFSVTLPLFVYSLLWRQGLRFEKDGFVSSSSVKNLFQRFKFF